MPCNHVVRFDSIWNRCGFANVSTLSFLPSKVQAARRSTAYACVPHYGFEAQLYSKSYSNRVTKLAFLTGFAPIWREWYSETRLQNKGFEVISGHGIVEVIGSSPLSSIEENKG